MSDVHQLKQHRQGYSVEGADAVIRANSYQDLSSGPPVQAYGRPLSQLQTSFQGRPYGGTGALTIGERDQDLRKQRNVDFFAEAKSAQYP